MEEYIHLLRLHTVLRSVYYVWLQSRHRQQEEQTRLAIIDFVSL
jgi:hypothetical protein